MKSLLGSLCLLVVSLAIALGLAEGMVRVFRAQLIYRFPQGLFVTDPVTSYALAPGFRGVIDTPEFRTAVQIDAQGWRADHDIGSKPPGTTRILMSGDSFTMGVGLEAEETLAAQLERGLASADNAARTEVINTGVPGYGTVQEVAALEARGLAVAPDAVVLVVFIGNDISDNATAAQVVRDGYLVAADGHAPSNWREHALRWINLHSQLYHLAEPWFDRLRGRSAAARIELRDGFRALYDPTSTAPGWAATAAALQRFATVTRQARVRAAVVLVPEGIQVSPPLWRAALVETGLDDHAVQPRVPNDRLLALSRQNALPVLDLTDALSADGDGARWYFPQDHHLTVAGTTQATTALLPFVRHWLAGDSASTQ